MKLFLTIVVVVIVMMLLARAAVGQRSQTSDEKVLYELRKAGSDLTKPHEIYHWLYFDDKADAETAAEQIRANDFSVSSIDETEKYGWRVLAHKRMIPSGVAVAGVSKVLESVAAANHGKYDGWETQVVK